MDNPRTPENERKGQFKKRVLPVPMWKDTAMVLGPLPPPPLRNRDERVKLLTHYDKRFTGDFVMHCHILYHEDRGMMQRIRVLTPSEAQRRKLPPSTAALSPSDKTTAAASTLPATNEANASFGPEAFVAVPGTTLMVFNKGLACSHCAEQVQKLATREKEFKELNVRIVAVSPEEVTKQAAEEYRSQYGVTFPLVADQERKLFRQFGLTGEPTHAVFLVDARGRTHAIAAGDAAETDIDKLLGKVRQVLGAPAKAAVEHTSVRLPTHAK